MDTERFKRKQIESLRYLSARKWTFYFYPLNAGEESCPRLRTVESFRKCWHEGCLSERTFLYMYVLRS